MLAQLLLAVAVVGRAFLIERELGWHCLPLPSLSSLSTRCVCGVVRCCISSPVLCIKLVGAVGGLALVRYTHVVVCFLRCGPPVRRCLYLPGWLCTDPPRILHYTSVIVASACCTI